MSRRRKDRIAAAKAIRQAKRDEKYALNHIDLGSRGAEVTPLLRTPIGKKIAAKPDRGMRRDRYRTVNVLEHPDRTMTEPGPYWRYNEFGRRRGFQAVPRARRVARNTESSTAQYRRLLRKELLEQGWVPQEALIPGPPEPEGK
jgi:hypothetical protein